MSASNLRRRLMVITLLPSALIAVILIAYFTLTALNTLEQEIRRKGLATVRYLAPVSEYEILAGHEKALQSLTQAVLQETGAKAAVLVNARGRMLAASGRTSLSSDMLQRNLPKPDVVAETDSWIAFGAPVLRSLEEVDPLFEVDGQLAQPEALGSVFVEFDKGELLHQERMLIGQALSFLVLALLALRYLAGRLATDLTRPVKRLVEAIEQVTHGQFATRVVNDTAGEIGILENGFNVMASHIEEAHKSMVTRIEEATAHLAYQARHDDLTGLIKRREFEERLNKALASVRTTGEAYCVMLVALDRVKQVSDACGYQAADELLRQAALLLQEQANDEELIARVGGNEFGVLIHDSIARARQLAEAICALVEQFRFVWGEKVFSLEISIGICAIPNDAQDVAAILAIVDAACHEAHTSGRSRIVERRSENQAESTSEGQWASLIEQGLAGQALAIEALPLMPIQSQLAKTHFVEISASFHLPGHSSITLAALVDAAERYGLASVIDQRLLDTAIQALARPSQQQALCCLIPISGASLRQTMVVDELASHLSASHLSGAGLCFLIQEDQLTSMTSQVMNFIKEVRILGCKICLDGFGGGLSSLGHLRGMKPDFIRLASSLAREFSSNRSSTALLRAIREITLDQNILLIADGINSHAMLEKISPLGVDLVGGMAVAPREPFATWLEGVILRREVPLSDARQMAGKRG